MNKVPLDRQPFDGARPNAVLPHPFDHGLWLFVRVRILCWAELAEVVLFACLSGLFALIREAESFRGHVLPVSFTGILVNVAKVLLGNVFPGLLSRFLFQGIVCIDQQFCLHLIDSGPLRQVSLRRQLHPILDVVLHIVFHLILRLNLGKSRSLVLESLLLLILLQVLLTII